MGVDGPHDDTDHEVSGGRRPRNKGGKSRRWKIPESGLQMLEQVYAVDKFPSVDTRKHLAANLEVTSRQVQVWFQNKRQRVVRSRSPGHAISGDVDLACKTLG